MHPVLEEPVAMLSFVMTASCGFTRNEVVLPSFKYVLLYGHIVYLVLFGLALYVPVNSYGHVGMIS